MWCWGLGRAGSHPHSLPLPVLAPGSLSASQTVRSDISSKASAYVAFGLSKIAGASCVTKERRVQDKPRRGDVGMQAFML